MRIPLPASARKYPREAVSLAIHEAGHAVVAARLGFAIHSASCGEVEGVVTYVEDAVQDPRATLRIHLAGPVAEAAAGLLTLDDYRYGWAGEFEGNDYVKVIEALTKIDGFEAGAPARRPAFNEAMADVIEILTGEWAAVCIVADDLLQFGFTFNHRIRKAIAV